MVLPVRIWLRFQYWTTLYRRKDGFSMPNLTTALYFKAKTAILMARTSGNLLAGIIASRFQKAHPDITSHRRKTKGKGRLKLESQEEHGDVSSLKMERGTLSRKPNSLSVVHTPRSKNAQKKARQRKRRQTQKREEIAATYSKQHEKLETPLMASEPAIDISPPTSLSSAESVLNSTVVGTPFTISTSGTFDPPTTCPPSTLWVSLSNNSSMDLQARRSFCEGFVDLESLSDEKQIVQTAGIHGKERMTDYVRDCESQQHLLCGASANTTKGGKFPVQNLSSLIDKMSAFVGAVQSSAPPMASFTPPLPPTTHTQPITQIPLKSRMSSSSSTLTEMKIDSSTDPFCTEWTTSSSPNLAANSQSFPGPIASALAYIPRSIPANRQMAQDSMRYQALAKPTDGSFFIDLMYHHLTCRKSGCQKICNLYDGSTVICPCCGPYSKTRYCCEDHLFLDLQSHWGSEKLTFDHYCVPDSIPGNVRESIPLLINIHGWDTPQRHRQAVCFNTSHKSADYCVFNYSSPSATGQENPYAQQKMSVVPLYHLKFDDPEERDRFRRCLAISLFAPVTNSRLVEYFFRLVRDKMKRLNLWNCYNAALVQDQIFRETGLDFPPNIVGPKHACQTEWNGRNPNHCHNAVCYSERLQYMMGDQRTRVFHRLECERLESLHWILRVNRTTHPTVKKAQDRMRGVGFGDVLLEHQRVFRRGEQFEGAGSGPIELEGVNC
ncbi:hypothetical protein N7509_010844 [Penicillium cosmopolitanum]|uniref:Uncharacterized protein n=1 Tax=Penicillium cosmopolitanum TaxID=1131564 RepID=A0A9W9VS60_9EURO|nr:uncharacterized protein N7509_010844 [Penicillium cosmopolitanum]KAJ5388303.1 hypothetical protein N7509_010844 [Penicillium cosmopolitanum]